MNRVQPDLGWSAIKSHVWLISRAPTKYFTTTTYLLRFGVSINDTVAIRRYVLKRGMFALRRSAVCANIWLFCTFDRKAERNESISPINQTALKYAPIPIVCGCGKARTANEAKGFRPKWFVSFAHTGRVRFCFTASLAGSIDRDRAQDCCNLLRWVLLLRQ